MYDTLTTKFKTCGFRCSKVCGRVRLKPHEFRLNNHAVHLLSDPHKQTKIADSELLTLNGYEEEGKHVVDPLTLNNNDGKTIVESKEEQASVASTSSKNSKKSKSKQSKLKRQETQKEVTEAFDRAKKAAKKAVFLRSEVSRSRYENWLLNLKLATALKKLFNSAGIKRAYKRLLAVESKLDGDVYGKILSVDNLTTIMGEGPAMEAVYLYVKIVGNSAHDNSTNHFFHSDSWHIKKTAEDIDLMQAAMDNVLAMVTILAQNQQKNKGGDGGARVLELASNQEALHSSNEREYGLKVLNIPRPPSTPRKGSTKIVPVGKETVVNKPSLKKAKSIRF